MSVPRLKRSVARMVPFSGMALDRAATFRADSLWVAQHLQEPTSRAVAANSEGVLLHDGIDTTLIRMSLPRHANGHLDVVEPILLGLEGGAALFAIDLDALGTSALASFAQGATIVALRDAGALLSRSEAGLAAYTVGLLNWHRTHRFCSNCGTATLVADAGYLRRCPSCGAEHFPRVDPVIMMLVDNASRLLLGRNPGWPDGQYSVLAGFVSPGESLEEAVAREVREESGIEVFNLRFVTSQPWPFPSSLLLGFEARSDGGEPSAGDGELEDVRWFPFEAVRAALTDASTELRLPPRVSLARFLIEWWATETG